MASLTQDNSNPQSADTQSTTPATAPGVERAGASSPSLLSNLRSLPVILRWVAGLVAIGIVLVVSLVLWGPGMEFPSSIAQPQSDGTVKDMQISRLISNDIRSFTTWLVKNWGGMFDGVDLFITYTMVGLEDSLRWLPWPAVFVGMALLAYALSGWRLSVLALASLSFIGVMNRWDSAVETIAIIIFSVALSVIFALPLGILGAKSDRFDGIMRPILDGMQTMPSYVYLVPGILFFGLGYTPAVIATVIYAVPPTIRLTNLGIRQVSSETVEAARSFGASPVQLLAKVQMPMAMPTIMAGINQTTMMALAMVVIASLVGASGLGEDVFRALQQQDPGNSVIAGMSIVLIAIVIDRLTQATARSRQESLE